VLTKIKEKPQKTGSQHRQILGNGQKNPHYVKSGQDQAYRYRDSGSSKQRLFGQRNQYQVPGAMEVDPTSRSKLHENNKQVYEDVSMRTQKLNFTEQNGDNDNFLGGSPCFRT